MTAHINVHINEDILKEFRDVIYHKMGLKRGDFKNAIEVSMLDYIIKYAELETAKEFAKRAKSKYLS